MDNRTWIVVADSGKARIFSALKARLFTNHDANELTLINEYAHADSRKMDSELVSDRQGHFGSSNFGSGNFSEETDPKRHQEDIFALEITRILSHAQNENKFHDLILIAPPAFMGMLNKHLTNETKKLISLRIEKDYTRHKEQQLVEQLQEYL